MPTVSLALVAALLFALANVLQQRVAMEFPDRLAHSPLFLVRLLRRPEWIAGMAIILAGFAFHAAALSDGQIVVVQPILSLTLVLSLPIGVRLTAQRIGPRDVALSLLVTIALGAFLVLSDPAAGIDDPSDSAWLLAEAAVIAPSAALLRRACAAGPRSRRRWWGRRPGSCSGFTARSSREWWSSSTTGCLGRSRAGSFTRS
jgi:drug/metabolite transporter (DMT)-like permease